MRGFVFDSIAGRPLAGAVVQAVVPGAATAPWTATTDSAGRLRMANLPAGPFVIGFYHDALTDLRLHAPRRSVELVAGAEVTADLAIPSSEAIRRLRCGEWSPFASGMLVGFVRDAENRAAIVETKATVHWLALALDSANCRVAKEQATATITENGMLLACQLPIDAPLNLLVTAMESAAATANITVANGRQRLDAVTMMGKPNRNLRVLDDVLRRSRVGMGTTFLPGHPALRSATFTSDVMKEARGFRWINGKLTVGLGDPGGYVPSAPPLPAPRVCALVLIWTRRHF